MIAQEKTRRANVRPLLWMPLLAEPDHRVALRHVLAHQHPVERHRADGRGHQVETVARGATVQ